MEVIAAGGDYLQARLHAAAEHRELAAELGLANRAVADLRRLGIDDPDSGPLAFVIERAERLLHCGDGLCAGYMQRYRRAKRSLRPLAVEDVAGLVGPGEGVGSVGELPQVRRDRDLPTVERRLGIAAERRAFGLGQIDRGFARPSMGQFHHGLAGGDHLPGFSQGLDDGPIEQ